MPWIRFKRWRYLTPLAPHVAVCASGKRYLWDGRDGGATRVKNQTDANELLDPIGGRQGDYEVAWEKYGVVFDAAGNEIEDNHTETTSDSLGVNLPDVSTRTSVVSFVKPKTKSKR